MPRVEARYYEKLDEGQVRCGLCPHHCLIKEGHQGICRVRINQAGTLFTLNYGEVSSLALDPIEKKPLYHYHPGSLILSAGTFGCNLACGFCQNYAIAHGQPATDYVNPEQMTAIAVQTRPEGSIGIAFTYNEPSIWFEYIYDTSQRLKEQNLKSVLVTNGYIEHQPWQKLLPYIDAMNIDVKAFNEGFYRRNCKARLDAVQATVEKAVGQVHVEITTLVIPGENDNIEEIKSLARWLASLNPLIPFHLSGYHPAYKMQKPSTPVKTLENAATAAREYLPFVYLGNLPGEQNDTCCLKCGQVLIKRWGYHIDVCGVKDGKCTSCGSETAYIKWD